VYRTAFIKGFINKITIIIKTFLQEKAVEATKQEKERKEEKT
jgi:hypothetical protein